MKIHQGIRPQDIVILLKMISLRNGNWMMKDLAKALLISQSEISESLNRSQMAGFVSRNKKVVNKEAVIEFISHGLKYTFPEEPGRIVKGFPTGQSAAPLYNVFNNSESYVWPHPKGSRRGHYIRPLHKNIPDACMKDDKLYELVALSDVIRIGSRSEKDKAVFELKRRILN
jgi:hypothetical protein